MRGGISVSDVENFADAFSDLIVAGNIEGVAKAIQSRSGINLDLQKNSQGEPMLSVAIKSGKIDIVKMLTEKNYDGKTLNMMCSIGGRDDENKTALMEACDYGNDSMLRQVPGRKDNRDNITRLLLERANESDITNVDANGLTPMMYACRSGNVVAVENMLDRLTKLGKSQEDIVVYLNQENRYGHTAVDLIYIGDRLDVEKLLKDRGYHDVLEHARMKSSEGVSREVDVGSDKQTKSKTSLVSKVKKMIGGKSKKKEFERKGSKMFPDYATSQDYLNDSNLNLNTANNVSLQDTMTLIEEEPQNMVSDMKEHINMGNTIVVDTTEFIQKSRKDSNSSIKTLVVEDESGVEKIRQLIDVTDSVSKDNSKIVEDNFLDDVAIQKLKNKTRGKNNILRRDRNENSKGISNKV